MPQSVNMSPPAQRTSWARPAALLFLAWLTFYLAQAAISMSLSPKSSLTPRDWIVMDLALAGVWTAASGAILVWHRKARVMAQGLWSLIALHAPLAFIVAGLDAIVSRAVLQNLGLGNSQVSIWATIAYYADFDIVSYVGVVVIGEALFIRRELLARQELAARLEAALNRARLDILETQLQPHFLFNSLGAVSELAYDAPATASLVLDQLSAVFRSTTTKRSDDVTLGDELLGIEPYLDIQRIRFADWLTIDYHIDDATVDCLVPRFVLQPLIENAIRHGLSGRDAPGTIRISSSLDDGTLVIRVSDDGVGLSAGRARPGHGIGLTNVRERLSIMYGDDDRLRLIDSRPGVTAELRVPARRRVRSTEMPAVAPANIASSDASGRSIVGTQLLRRGWVNVISIWAACGAVWVQQSYLFVTLRARTDLSWISMARFDLLYAALWAMLTPIVFRVARTIPIKRSRAVLRVLGLLAMGLVTTFVHVDIMRVVTGSQAPFWSRAYQPNMLVDFTIYCVLVAIAHRGVLVEWLKARDAEAAKLAADLSTLHDRSIEMQAIPRTLLATLDGISRTVRKDPGLTERQLATLADYLRIALECTDAAGVTPDRQTRLDRAVDALREIGAYRSDLRTA